MKDRIKHYIDFKGITAGELAVILDVQRSNISHILNGRNKPGAAFIEKLLNAFPDLNARWLFTGTGGMVDGKPEQAKEPNTLFNSASEMELPTKKEVSAPAKILQPEKIGPQIQSIPEQSISNADIDKIILVYDDGTFTTLNQRKDNRHK